MSRRIHRHAGTPRYFDVPLVDGIDRAFWAGRERAAREARERREAHQARQ